MVFIAKPCDPVCGGNYALQKRYVYLLLRTIVSNMQNVANVAGNINSLHSVISQTDFHLIVSLFSG